MPPGRRSQVELQSVSAASYLAGGFRTHIISSRHRLHDTRWTRNRADGAAEAVRYVC